MGESEPRLQGVAPLAEKVSKPLLPVALVVEGQALLGRFELGAKEGCPGGKPSLIEEVLYDYYLYVEVISRYHGI